LLNCSVLLDELWTRAGAGPTTSFVSDGDYRRFALGRLQMAMKRVPLPRFK
jgi:hypothetical protein